LLSVRLNYVQLLQNSAYLQSNSSTITTEIVLAKRKAEKLFGLTKQELIGMSIFEFMEDSEQLRTATADYFSAGSSKLIGTTTRQRVRDICGQIFNVEMVISVSQYDQSQLFSAILRAVKD
jgi:PAS domain S-box-containing protein